MTRKRWVVLGGIALVIVLALLLGTCGSGVEVEVSPAERGPLRVTVEEEGRTRARERFVVAAPINGALQRIDLREGATVAAGEVLARIASRTPAEPAESSAEAVRAGRDAS